MYPLKGEEPARWGRAAGYEKAVYCINQDVLSIYD